MTGEWFQELVKGLNRGFCVQDKQLTNNCPAHPTTGGLTNIQLVLLLSNITSVLQPMDQGAIRTLENHFKKRIVRKLIRALNKNVSLQKVSMLGTMNFVVSSQSAVLTETIVNSFRKVRISSSSQELTQTHDDDAFKELNREPSRLREINPSKIEISADEFLEFDDNVCTTEEHLITDEEILSSLVSSIGHGENDNNIVEENDVLPLSNISNFFSVSGTWR